MRIRDVIRGGLLLTAAVAVLALERRRRARPYVEPHATHTTRNLAVAGIAAATVQLLETPVVMPLARAVEGRRWGLTHAIGGPPWLRGLIAVILLDYTLYLWHVIVHRVPWLWRFHLVHHVDLDLDVSTDSGSTPVSSPPRSVACGPGSRHRGVARLARGLAEPDPRIGAFSSLELEAERPHRARPFVDRRHTAHARDSSLGRTRADAVELLERTGDLGPCAWHRAL